MWCNCPGCEVVITHGRTRIFRPVCILRQFASRRYPPGYSGGPAGYEEVDDPAAETLILVAVIDGKAPLKRQDEL